MSRYMFLKSSNLISGDVSLKHGLYNVLKDLRVHSFSGSHQSQYCISHLQSGGCAQQDRGSCPAFTERIVSAGHVNCHGDAACSTGQREAGCSLCNLLSVGSFHTDQSTHKLSPYATRFSLHS